MNSIGPARFEPVRHTRFDDYLIVGHLAAGGMADVYLALREGSKGFRKLEVIKCLNLADDEYVEMFQDEARLSALLDHPNIVQTHKVGEFEDRHFLVMEYLEGVPLSKLVRAAYKTSKLAPHLAVFIATEVLNGLAYAHDAVDLDGDQLEIVHRDVSPNNVFITRQGSIKLLDFGIARATNRDTTSDGSVVRGKLAYIAPEQAKGEQVNRRADLFSLGVVMWELLTGYRLFKGETEAETIRKTIASDISPPSQYREEIPPELDAVVMKALERDPDNRFANASEMRRPLEAWLQQNSTPHLRDELTELMQAHFSEPLQATRTMIRQTLEALGHETQTSSFPAVASTRATPPAPRSWRYFGVVALLFVGAFGIGLGLAIIGEEEPSARTAAASGDPVKVSQSRAKQPEKLALAAQSRPATAGDESPFEVAQTPAPTRPSPASSIVPNSQRSAPVASTAIPGSSQAASAKQPNSAKKLRSPTPTKGADKGFLTLDTTPWSEVTLNGRRLGVTPLANVELPSGSHTLVLRNPQIGIRTQYTVNIQPGKTLTRRLGID